MLQALSWEWGPHAEEVNNHSSDGSESCLPADMKNEVKGKNTSSTELKGVCVILGSLGTSHSLAFPHFHRSQRRFKNTYVAAYPYCFPILLNSTATWKNHGTRKGRTLSLLVCDKREMRIIAAAAYDFPCFIIPQEDGLAHWEGKVRLGRPWGTVSKMGN